MRKILKAVFLVLVAFSGRIALGGQSTNPSTVTFASSVPPIQDAFTWAKEQALAYAHADNRSPVGPWYEAALPNRESFCMRDVSHQADAAEILGLSAANKNMFTRFVESIDEKRDWCGYWEINSNAKPSPADYINDEDFWYNLPANFDVVDAAFRLRAWTGDAEYTDGHAFANFFRITTANYVNAWQLAPTDMLGRSRILNMRAKTGRYVEHRGIPSYVESKGGFNVGVDLLATEYRAFKQVQGIARRSRNEELALNAQTSAEQLSQLIEKSAWLDAEQHYAGLLEPGKPAVGSGDVFLLRMAAIADPRRVGKSLDYISSAGFKATIEGIEIESYLPETLYAYGRIKAAEDYLLDLSAPWKHRREYPEVSYAVVGAIVRGRMGINVTEDGAITSLAQTSDADATDTIDHLPILQTEIGITHKGIAFTEFRNEGASVLRWRMRFKADFGRIRINGRLVAPTQQTLPGGVNVVEAVANVAPGATVVASLK